MACAVRPLGHFARPLLFLTIVFAVTTAASAQSHFSCLDGAGNIYNASIILPSASAPKIGGASLSLGSEIAAFSSDPAYADICVGKVVWNNAAVAMAVWGDDDLTPEQDGLMPSDSIKLFVWDSLTDIEHEITSEHLTYLSGSGIYEHDAALVIASLAIPGGGAEPVATPDIATLDEDSSISVDVLANDLEGAATLDPSTVVVVSPPQQGQILSLDPLSGAIEYKPNDNYSGLDSLSYRVSDASGLTTNPVWISITINDVNDAPVFDESPVTNATQDILFEAPLITSDIEGHSRSITSSNLPAWLGITDNADGTALLSGTPSPSDLGDHSILITVTDSEGGSTDLNLTITVSEIALTIARDDTKTGDEDTEMAIDVLANDIDGHLPIDPGSLKIVSSPLHGTVASVDVNSGVINYLPDPNYHGADSLSYIIYNVDRTDSSSARLILTVNSVNDAPFAGGDAALLDEDTVHAIDVLSNDVDADGDELNAASVSITSPPLHGTIESIHPSTGIVRYVPNEDYNGADSFSYQVDDVHGEGSNAAQVAIWIDAVNDAPRLQNTPVVRGAQYIPYTYAPMFSDPESDAISVSATQLPAWLQFVDNGDGTASLAGTPSPANVGNHAVQLIAIDQSGAAETTNFSIMIEDNAAPFTAQDDVQAEEDVVILIDVLSNDADPENDALDFASLTIVTPPLHGNIMDIDAVTGVIRYDPHEDFNGTDSFEYQITDVEGSVSDPGVVVLSISPVNDAPLAVSDHVYTSEDLPAVVDVLINDSDLDGDILWVTAVSSPIFGTVAINADEESVTYIPNANYFGPDSFTYTVQDPDGLTSTSDITVSVQAVNDAPQILSSPEVIVLPGTQYLYSFVANDVDGDPLIITAATIPSWMDLSLESNGTASLTGVAGPAEMGVHDVSIEVSDGTATVVQQFSVSVTDLTTPLTEQTQLTGPAWGAINLPQNPRFTWVMMENATSYHLQITELEDNNFTSPAMEDSTIVPRVDATTPGSVVHYDVVGLASGTTYVWRVRARNAGGYSPWSEGSRFSTFASSTPTEDELDVPVTAELFQNYPNPFNPTTTISFELPGTGDVRLTVFDLMGREVDVLVSETLSAGRHEIRWDAGDLASGMYLYRLQAGSYVKSKTLSLIK